MEKRILIKIGEIFLKGQNRKSFENKLLQNIKDRISKFGNFFIHSFGAVNAIYSKENNLDILIPHLYKIPGISAFSKAYRADKDLLEIKTVACEILKKINNINTFKIESKRSDKTFYINSPMISSEVGAYIVENLGLTVNVTKPDVILNIEIRIDSAYLYTNLDTYPGLGGLPSGSSGKCVVMLSGGIDSPVASFLLAKRGVDLLCIHFATPPYTSEMAKLKVQKIVKVLSVYCVNISLLIVNFTKIQQNINKYCSKDFFTIISRRIMNRISQTIAKKKKALAIITGESLGQVASQTLNSIFCTNESVEIPILRPLIGMDKNEITNIAKKIGTFEISIEPYEDCCSIFSPKHPCIKPNLEFVKINENKIPNLNGLIDECLEDLQIFKIQY